MCDPLSAAIALAVVGAGTSYVGEQKAASARERTFMEERIRQRGLQDEQSGRFQDSLAKVQDMVTPDAAKKASDKRESALVAAIRPSTSSSAYLPGAGSAPAVVATANDNAQATANTDSMNLASAIAALGGTGDQMQQLGTDINRNSTAIGQLGGFQRGSQGVLQDEMRAANAKGGNLRALGGLAQSIGTAWMGGQLGAAAGGMGKSLSNVKVV